MGRPTHSSQEIAFKQSELLRDIKLALEEARRKEQHTRLLLENGELPLMISDMPTKEWMAIERLAYSLGTLRELERKVRFRRTRRKT